MDTPYIVVNNKIYKLKNLILLNNINAPVNYHYALKKKNNPNLITVNYFKFMGMINQFIVVFIF